MTTDTEALYVLPEEECLNYAHRGEGRCEGPVEYREPLSGTGVSYPRCAAHWEQRLDLQEQLAQRYPEHPPSDWSPLDAGEHWDEEDY